MSSMVVELKIDPKLFITAKQLVKLNNEAIKHDQNKCLKEEAIAEYNPEIGFHICQAWQHWKGETITCIRIMIAIPTKDKPKTDNDFAFPLLDVTETQWKKLSKQVHK
jgi:hypothetical protein